jgi:hypothetical protein
VGSQQLPVCAAAGSQRGFHTERSTCVPAVSRRRLMVCVGSGENSCRVCPWPHTWRANKEWALDFVSDSLANGGGIRVLAIVDLFTRENLSSETDMSLSSPG